MSKERNPAELAAEEVRKRIIDCLDNQRHFLVEAGAGAGKTYSLIESLRHLTETRGRDLLRRNQRVACITYTNVANDEIRSRTDRHPAIQSDTIHSFCWSLIKPFQSSLRREVQKLGKWPERLEPVGGIGDRVIDYNLGYPKVEERQLLLQHNDVLALTVNLLEEPKFRQLVADRFPILLIDEYQDTDKAFAAAIISHFGTISSGMLLGFFGDHWQKIYGSGCGQISNANIQPIGKEANFRSVPAIVHVLNRLRPELPQAVMNPDAVGTATVFHTNAWIGIRQSGGHTKGDLPSDVGHAYLEGIRTRLTNDGWDFAPDNTKILMLTHRVLASEQGYSALADVFDRNESFIQKEDSFIAFFADIVEPVCTAYSANRFGEMFSILGAKRPSLSCQDDKARWKQEMDQLMALRAGESIGAVIDHLRSSKLGLPNAVQRREERAAKAELDEADSAAAERLQKLREVPYLEMVALAKFIDGHTPFETKHGVKGNEFENVLVVFGRGWSQFNFNQLLEQLGSAVPAAKQDSYERNRNLFYVACSRPKRRLALLFTQELSKTALSTLSRLFGADAIHALPATPAKVA